MKGPSSVHCGTLTMADVKERVVGARSAPATGCFGELCDSEALTRRSPADVYAEWETVAFRFYQIGYGDGKTRR